MFNASNVALGIIILIALVSVGVIAYCSVINVPIPSVMMTLLGVVLGFLGSHLASTQGANQALSTPTQADGSKI